MCFQKTIEVKKWIKKGALLECTHKDVDDSQSMKNSPLMTSNQVPLKEE